MPPPVPQADALLCERCGYAVGGLAEPSPCPECGTAAGESWPRARPGSRFQRRLPGAWLLTNANVVRSPRQHARRLRIDSGSSSRLLHTNLFLTAAMLVPGVMPVHGEWLMVVPFAWLFMYAGLLLLTFIETVGLRFFARAAWRRWRVTPAVAWTVCDHASVGWVVGGLLNLLFVAAEPVARLARWEWGNELAKRLIGVPITAFVSDTTALRVYASLLLGMLTFETLVFIGVRQCRWANTPASVSQQGPGCAGGSRDAATPDA